MPLKKLLFLIPAFIFLSPYPGMGSGYLQVVGLIDLRTTYSDGELDLESLVKLAKKRGFSVLFINDHDRLAMEYGLFPFRNILRKRVELNSINKGGAEEYLNGIRDVQRRHPDMIIIPGSETAPFYYWTGSYLDKNLTAHNHERRILTIGLQQPEDYRNLPILHNGSSTNYLRVSLPKILPFVVAFILGFVTLKRRGIPRILGIVISGLSVLFIIDLNPFRSSPFDQYHGDQGIAPHQLLIDYVDSRDGLTFWNYPETRSGIRKMGPILVDTPPYPEALQQSKNYNGFSALYGDRITATEPGNVWDRVLLEHCKGERDRPVWGISTADFHKDGGAGEKLGNFPTVFLVRKKTNEDIIAAMREGRMYACRGKYPQRMILNDFSICSSRCETRGTSGNEIVLKENPRIHLSLSLRKPTDNQVVVRLIRSGELIKTFHGSLPTKINYEDNYFKPGQKVYYRIDVRGCGTLVSNPIFVTFGQHHIAFQKNPK
jgi:hypothetical protein